MTHRKRDEEYSSRKSRLTSGDEESIIPWHPYAWTSWGDFLKSILANDKTSWFGAAYPHAGHLPNDIVDSVASFLDTTEPTPKEAAWLASIVDHAAEKPTVVTVEPLVTLGRLPVLDSFMANRPGVVEKILDPSRPCTLHSAFLIRMLAYNKQVSNAIVHHFQKGHPTVEFALVATSDADHRFEVCPSPLETIMSFSRENRDVFFDTVMAHQPTSRFGSFMNMSLCEFEMTSEQSKIMFDHLLSFRDTHSHRIIMFHVGLSAKCIDYKHWVKLCESIEVPTGEDVFVDMNYFVTNLMKREDPRFARFAIQKFKVHFALPTSSDRIKLLQRTFDDLSDIVEHSEIVSHWVRELQTQSCFWYLTDEIKHFTTALLMMGSALVLPHLKTFENLYRATLAVFVEKWTKMDKYAKSLALSVKIDMMRVYRMCDVAPPEWCRAI